MRRSIEVPGGRFAYLEAGGEDLPLVLCLHGFPDHPTTFEGFLGTLAEAGYRAVAPWMRGYSPSVLEGPYDATQLAQDVIELADALSPRRSFAIIGHDWGAIAAIAAAPRLATRLACGVTLAMPHPVALLGNMRRSPTQLLRSRYIGFFQLRGVSDRVVWSRDFSYVEELWKKWSPDYEMTPEHRARLKTCLAASMPAPLRYYRDIFSRGTLRAIGGSRIISQPFLHLHGANDGCISATMAREQGRYFRELSSEIIPDAGHFLHLEAGPQVINRSLAWLRRYLPC